jgi:hypothetical protein
MQAKRATSLTLALLFGAVLPAVAAVEIDSNTFGALRARSIGPAVMSGRIAAIDAVAEDPLVIRQRRRLEVSRRGSDLEAGLRRAQSVDRRHPHRSAGCRDRLGRHRRAVDA